MINYTERLTLLMQDIVARVPTLSFIDIADVLVFARFGPLRTPKARSPPATASAFRRASPATTSGAIATTGQNHAPLGVVRHQVAGRHDRRRAR